MTKEVKARLNKECSVCGKSIRVILYADKSHRGGHFFGKVPLYTDAALREALKAGYREVGLNGKMLRVLKKDPKAYKYAEYWECSKCYWNRKN